MCVCAARQTARTAPEETTAPAADTTRPPLDETTSDEPGALHLRMRGGAESASPSDDDTGPSDEGDGDYSPGEEEEEAEEEDDDELEEEVEEEVAEAAEAEVASHAEGFNSEAGDMGGEGHGANAEDELEGAIDRGVRRVGMGFPFEPQNPQDYDTCFKSFLGTHYKVGGDFVSTSIQPGQYTVLSDKSMRKRFAHLKYAVVTQDKDGNDETALKPFIGAFLTDARLDEIMYHRFVVCPGQLPCPDMAFNLWTPFDIEGYPQLPKADAFVPAHEDGGVRAGWVFKNGEHGLGYYCDRALLNKRVHNLARILERNGTLTDHEWKACNFLLDWQAQMYQFPETKSVMVVIISKQGAGKGQFLELHKKIMGRGKVLTTTTPERQVWGPYNLKMGTAFFVHLDELGPSAFEKNAKDIKALITDPTMNVLGPLRQNQALSKWPSKRRTAQAPYYPPVVVGSLAFSCNMRGFRNPALGV